MRLIPMFTVFFLMLFLDVANPANSFFNGIADNTWVKVNTDGLNTSSGILAYSGMAYDSKNEQILVFGGGHWDYAGNDVWAFDINTLKWQQMYKPNCSSSYAPTRHSYDTPEFITSIGEMFVQGAVRYYGESCGSLGTWSYNYATNKWTRRNASGGSAPNGEGASTAYDPVNDVVWHARSSKTWKYVVKTDRYEQVNTIGSHNGGNETALTYAKERHALYQFGSEWENHNDLWEYDVAANKWTLMPTGSTKPPATGGYGLVYDQVGDAILAVRGAGLWIYDLRKQQWSTGASAPADGRVHGDFKYDPVNNVSFLVVPGIDTWVYRYKKDQSGVGGKTPDLVNGQIFLNAAPNPFNNATHLHFTLKNTETVDLSIYNANGVLIKKLMSGYTHKGVYFLKWTRTKSGRGLFLARLKTGSMVVTRKLLTLN